MGVADALSEGAVEALLLYHDAASGQKHPLLLLSIAHSLIVLLLLRFRPKLSRLKVIVTELWRRLVKVFSLIVIFHLLLLLFLEILPLQLFVQDLVSIRPFGLVHLAQAMLLVFLIWLRHYSVIEVATLQLEQDALVAVGMLGLLWWYHRCRRLADYRSVTRFVGFGGLRHGRGAFVAAGAFEILLGLSISSWLFRLFDERSCSSCFCFL